MNHITDTSLSAAVARGALIAAVVDAAEATIAGFDVVHHHMSGVKIHVNTHDDGGGFDRVRHALGLDIVTVDGSIVYARGDWQGIRVEVFADAKSAGYAECACGCGHTCRSGS